MTANSFHAAKQSEKRQSEIYLALIVSIAVGMLIGGGGIRFPMFEMLVQLAVLPALVLGVISIEREQWRAVRVPIYLLVVAALLALLQIIPMPSGFWQSLPGRETLAEIAALTGRGDEWRALSIRPELTLQSALTLTIPLAVLLSFACLNPIQRENVCFFVLILAGVHILVSFAQTISGGTSFYIFETTHEGLPIGLFANRNHTAQLMLMCMFLLIGLLLPRAKDETLSPARLMICAASVVLFAFVIVATNSRTVSVLMILALAVIGWQLVSRLRVGKRYILFGSVGLAGLLGLAVFFFNGKGGAASDLIDRFEAMEDHRFEFWPIALDAMNSYLPFGSGLGTFDMAFRTVEPLETVGTHFVNAAHNDFIEIAIETGVFGPILLALFLGWITQRFLRLARKDPLARNASFAIACIMLHSLTDYPIRTYAILVPAAVLLAAFAMARPNSADVQPIK